MSHKTTAIRHLDSTALSLEKSINALRLVKVSDQSIKKQIAHLRDRLDSLEIVDVPKIKRSEEENYYHAIFTIRGIEYFAFYDEDYNLKSLSWLNNDHYDPLREITKGLYSEIIDMIIRTHLETKK